MIVALASPRIASSLDDGLERIERLLSDAAARGAAIVCFPEAYLPGLRGQDFEVPPFDRADQERALAAVAHSARAHAHRRRSSGMERLTAAGRQIAAFVVDAEGRTLGYQTKNQLDPTEDPFYVPGDTRRLFEVDGVKFGVAICHEGWRYPETVRWAAVRGRQDRLSSAAHRQRSRGRPPDAVGRGRGSLLREGDDDAQPREHDLLRQRQLRAALPGVGDEPDRAVGSVPGAPALRTGRRAGAGASTSRTRRACSPRATRRSATASPARRPQTVDSDRRL